MISVNQTKLIEYLVFLLFKERMRQKVRERKISLHLFTFYLKDDDNDVDSVEEVLNINLKMFT